MPEDPGALIFTWIGDGRRFLEGIPARDLYEADTVLLTPAQLGSLIPSGLYAEAATRSTRRSSAPAGEKE